MAQGDAPMSVYISLPICKGVPRGIPDYMIHRKNRYIS